MVKIRYLGCSPTLAEVIDDQHEFNDAVDFHMKTIVQSHRRAGLSSRESQKHQSN